MFVWKRVLETKTQWVRAKKLLKRLNVSSLCKEKGGGGRHWLDQSSHTPLYENEQKEREIIYWRLLFKLHNHKQFKHFSTDKNGLDMAQHLANTIHQKKLTLFNRVVIHFQSKLLLRLSTSDWKCSALRYQSLYWASKPHLQQKF